MRNVGYPWTEQGLSGRRKAKVTESRLRQIPPTDRFHLTCSVSTVLQRFLNELPALENWEESVVRLLHQRPGVFAPPYIQTRGQLPSDSGSGHTACFGQRDNNKRDLRRDFKSTEVSVLQWGSPSFCSHK